MSRFKRAEKLDDVKDIIQDILMACKETESALGFFAALYVTVANAIENAVNTRQFDDNERLARVDVNFVNLYIDAMNAAFDGTPAKPHWQVVIDAAKTDKYLVLEYLFVSMNAHINYDLSAACAMSVPKDEFVGFKPDFLKVNNILFSLLDRVQKDVSYMFNLLKLYLKFGEKFDDKVIAFIMGGMREEAYTFACELALCNPDQFEKISQEKMTDVANISSKILYHKSWFVRGAIGLARKMEKGSVAQKIGDLLR